MEQKNIYTLGEILKKAADYKWNDSLLCETNRPFTTGTKCIILTDDEITETDGVKNGTDITTKVDGQFFRMVFDMQTVQSICENAGNQKPDITPEDLLKAFIFYHENDAFIEFDEDISLEGK